MKECGIERTRIDRFTGERVEICFHSLRHQTATRWVKSGMDARLVAKAMGHSVRMLEHYSDHFDFEDMETLRRGLAETNALGA